MKVLIAGASGMLGSDLSQYLESQGHTVIGFNSKTLDITSPESVTSTLTPFTDADVLFNCAAYTKVDQAESEEDLACRLNGDGPGHLANFCAGCDMALVHFSTDYIFNGRGNEPYKEDDPTDPINAYGRSKLAGEVAIKDATNKYYIFRIQWLYGENGANFVKTISRLAGEKEQLSIVDDQHGSPSWTKDIAEYVSKAITEKVPYGVYHLANSGYTTWYGFAKHFVSSMDTNCQVSPTTSDAYPTPATRPENSRLSLEKFDALGLGLPRVWQDAVLEFLGSGEKKAGPI